MEGRERERARAREMWMEERSSRIKVGKLEIDEMGFQSLESMDPIGTCKMYDCVEGTRKEREYTRNFKGGGWWWRREKTAGKDLRPCARRELWRC